MSLWLEYRLDRLTFSDGRKILFPPESRMLYNPDDHIIAVETSREKLAQVRAAADGPELRRIDYAMLVNVPEFKGTLKFYHPMQAGNAVRVRFNDRGQLFFLNDEGRALFSKDFTLRDVSRGEIDSDRAVWQFHGYRHEH